MSPNDRRRRLTGLMLVSALLLLISVSLLFAQSGLAANATPAGTLLTAPLAKTSAQNAVIIHNAPDQACRLCHAESDTVITLPDGSEIPVEVDLAALSNSAHGVQAETPLACTNCHAPAEHQFPHAPIDYPDLRSYELARSATCERCHSQPHITSHPGPESENPVVCTDCHGSHEVLTVAELQAGAGTQACVDCHTTAGLELVDPAELTSIIQNGLFAPRVSSEYCLACHSRPGIVTTLSGGETLPLTVNPDDLHASVHGADNPWQPLVCNDCHEGYRFPHEPIQEATLREYRIARYPLCVDCHEQKYDRTQDDVHGTALDEGNLNAAVCTDCHGSHNTPTPNEPRSRISHTCQQCHSTIFDQYRESVHGSALIDDENEDVPTCIDCHGVHNIANPTTTLYRVRSPEICAQCHADEELMSQYDISTDVFRTYVADFHGTSALLFDSSDPSSQFNEAVCYDCHGVHDIRRPDDPDNGIQANLLATCQQCHPDATENFPAAWTSHYVPSLQNNPGIYLVNLFYQIVIPTTLASLGFLVVTDIYRRVRFRFRKPQPQEQDNNEQ